MNFVKSFMVLTLVVGSYAKAGIVERIECERPGFGDGQWNTLHITIEPKGDAYWAVESLIEVFADVKPRVLHSKMREIEVSLQLGVKHIEVKDANDQSILSISLEGQQPYLTKNAYRCWVR